MDFIDNDFNDFDKQINKINYKIKIKEYLRANLPLYYHCSGDYVSKMQDFSNTDKKKWIIYKDMCMFSIEYEIDNYNKLDIDIIKKGFFKIWLGEGEKNKYLIFENNKLDFIEKEKENKLIIKVDFDKLLLNYYFLPTGGLLYEDIFFSFYTLKKINNINCYYNLGIPGNDDYELIRTFSHLIFYNDFELFKINYDFNNIFIINSNKIIKGPISLQIKIYNDDEININFIKLIIDDKTIIKNILDINKISYNEYQIINIDNFQNLKLEFEDNLNFKNNIEVKLIFINILKFSHGLSKKYIDKFKFEYIKKNDGIYNYNQKPKNITNLNI